MHSEPNNITQHRLARAKGCEVDCEVNTAHTWRLHPENLDFVNALNAGASSSACPASSQSQSARFSAKQTAFGTLQPPLGGTGRSLRLRRSVARRPGGLSVPRTAESGFCSSEERDFRHSRSKLQMNSAAASPHDFGVATRLWTCSPLGQVARAQAASRAREEVLHGLLRRLLRGGAGNDQGRA